MRVARLGLFQPCFALAAVMALAGLRDASAQGAPSSPRPAIAAPSPSYPDWFTDEAMRVDLFHTGTGKEDVYSLDEIVWEPPVARHPRAPD